MIKRSATILAAVTLAPLLLAAGSPGCGGAGGGVTPEEEEEETVETEEIAPTGVLEATFVTDVAGFNDRGQGVAVQEDGKIVVCGQSSAGSDADLLVLRYNSDGSLDLQIVTKASSEDECAFGVKIDDKGRIVVAGWAKVGGISKFVLARYLSDGALDGGFGTNGISFPAVGDSTKDAAAYALAIQSDGKLVAAGNATFDGTSRIALYRCQEDGTPDSTFGDGAGVASATFGSTAMPWSSGSKMLAIDGSGRIVAAGWVRPAATTTGTDFGIARFDSNGQSDFLVNVDLGNSRDDHVYGLAFQEDKIVAIGNTDNGTNHDLAMVRLNEDGSVDSSFAANGKLTMDYSSSTELFGGVIVGKNQELYVGGTITLPTPSSNFAVASFDKDGNLNTSFGSGGFLLTAVNGKQSNSLHMTRQKDGKLVQVGTIMTSGTNTDVAVARYQ